MSALLTGLGPLLPLTTKPVNSPLPPSFLWCAGPVYTLTAGLNLVMGMVLARQDRTPVNLLMLADCLTGCLHSVLALFGQSPAFTGLAWPAYCYAHFLLLGTAILLNRLVPVAIAVHRYLLVCHGPRLRGRQPRLGVVITLVALLLPAALRDRTATSVGIVSIHGVVYKLLHNTTATTDVLVSRSVWSLWCTESVVIRFWSAWAERRPSPRICQTCWPGRSTGCSSDFPSGTRSAALSISICSHFSSSSLSSTIGYLSLGKTRTITYKVNICCSNYDLFYASLNNINSL